MSEDKKAPEPAPADAQAPSSGGGNKLVMILSIVNLLATLGMVGILFMSFQKEKSKPNVEDIAVGGHGEAAAGGHGEAAGGHGTDSKKHSAKFGKMITLDQFTINVSTPGSNNPKFVRVNISLEVPGDDTEAEVNQKMPQVRNAIIDLVNSKRATDLSSTEGRDYLKEEIKNALNSFMVSGKVKGVFFTNFAVTS